MAKTARSTPPSTKVSKPTNSRGYQGGQLPAGEIAPPPGPAADVPVRTKERAK